MDLNLKNKTALITGASRGIGLAIKKALEAEGVKCISWSRSEGVDLMKKIPQMPKIDFVIHNVGGGGTWVQSEWEQIMQKNYGILASLINNLAESVTRVICISSIFGKEAGFSEAFTAAKSAEIAYMKCCSRKYSGITYNTICPGHIDVGKKMPYTPEIIGKPEDVANIVTFLCSDKAKHINGACITVDGGESHRF